MLKKLKNLHRIALPLAAALCLSACGTGADVETLLRAPQLSGESSALQRAVNSYVGGSVTLKYPNSGDFLSPFAFGDWDGDGTQEAAVLYTTDTTGSNVWLAVLEPEGESAWRVSQAVEGLSTEVQAFATAPLRNADSLQILTGYGSAQGDKYLVVYQYDQGELQTVIMQSYTELLLADITGSGDGTQDLVLALPTETENGGVTLQLLTTVDGVFHSVQTLDLGKGDYSGCAALHAGAGANGQTYLVMDAWARDDTLVSAIIVYDAESGSLQSYHPVGFDDVLRSTRRYDAALISRDIDGNGTIDIPLEIDDGGTLKTPVDKQLRFLLWKDYATPSGGRSLFGVYDTAAGFFVPLPESMHGSILIRSNQAGTGWLICNAEGTTVYCELRVVDPALTSDPAQLEGSYRRIATIDGEQLQLRMVTDYYGLSHENIAAGTVVLD